jgi:hypothetical protein
VKERKRVGGREIEEKREGERETERKRERKRDRGREKERKRGRRKREGEEERKRGRRKRKRHPLSTLGYIVRQGKARQLSPFSLCWNSSLSWLISYRASNSSDTPTPSPPIIPWL